MNLRVAVESDIDAIASIYRECFPREANHGAWIAASFRSAPRAVYYVAEGKAGVTGYILWTVKNGFRHSTIVELEQIAVHPAHAGKGQGKRLIASSFEKFERHVTEMGFSIGAVLVTTSKGNFAEKLYQSVLGVRTVAEVENYGSGSELIMYKRRK